MPQTSSTPARPAAAPRPAPLERVLPWALTACWLVLPFTAGQAVGAGLSGRSHPVQIVATAAAWLLWGGTLLAGLVAHPVSLTVVRVVAPLAASVTMWWAVTAEGSGARGGLGGALAVAATVDAFLADTGHRHVNGPAYPNERRFLLRPPGLLLLGPLPAAWLLVVGGALAGPLLLAARAWAAGGAALLLGFPAGVVAARSLHGLSRRFAVFVPAGFVLHDLMALRDPVLFPRSRIEAIRLAAADTDSLDLTLRAVGPAVEVLLREKAEVTLVKAGTPGGVPGGTARFLLAPTRPGRLLLEARDRRLG